MLSRFAQIRRGPRPLALSSALDLHNLAYLFLLSLGLAGEQFISFVDINPPLEPRPSFLVCEPCRFGSPPSFAIGPMGNR
jgi:hypothetical protein